ncbi:hypothetical protein LKD37_14590 [Oscillospiraceae bacterium CLA-AA-H272]|jgi:hypothetical protein|uniref:Uncharacterized protein n=1 Tax=Brotocaccenecus cirricatena TaxID=3064195 RepID=A0AAE3AHH0_9FIRM|nr:hypothetical protein [Brotocaccenecus cirricatena]MCC2130722.1 hypothetical protein [Brotocaccenecus cirricatena]
MNKIIFFEGLHGSGKSTLAKEKSAELRRIYPKVQIVMRCEKPCPIDISRLAVLSEKEFRMFIHMIRPICSEDAHTIEYQLMRFSSLEGEHYYVNWFEFLSQYHLWDKKVISYALNHELCDGKAGYEQYVEITRNRWKAFAKAISDNTVYLFEGALLQHPIIELLGYYELDDSSIAQYINILLETVCEISTELVYISTDQPEQLLWHTALKRNDQGYHWIDGLIKLATTCNYGKKHGLLGFQGAVQFCTDRMRIEKQILDQVTIKKEIILHKFDS